MRTLDYRNRTVPQQLPQHKRATGLRMIFDHDYLADAVTEARLTVRTSSEGDEVYSLNSVDDPDCFVLTTDGQVTVAVAARYTQRVAMGRWRIGLTIETADDAMKPLDAVYVLDGSPPDSGNGYLVDSDLVVLQREIDDAAKEEADMASRPGRTYLRSAIAAGDTVGYARVQVSAEYIGRWAVVNEATSIAELALVDTTGQLVAARGTFANDHAERSTVLLLPTLVVTDAMFGGGQSALAGQNRAAIQAAIDAVYGASEKPEYIADNSMVGTVTLNRHTAFASGEVRIAGGLRQVDGEILVRRGVTLNLDGGGIFATTNDYVLVPERNAVVKNGIIATWQVGGYSKAPIYLDGKEFFTVRNRTQFHNMQLWGNASERLGAGIEIYAGGDSNNNVTGCLFSNFRVHDYESGIKIHGDTDHTWANSNTFFNFLYVTCATNIVMSAPGADSASIASNAFIDHTGEQASISIKHILMDGPGVAENTFIRQSIWDSHVGQNITMRGGTFGNEVSGDFDLDDIDDQDGNNNIMPTNTTLRPTKASLTPLSALNHNFTGANDVLVHCHLLNDYTVSRTGPDAGGSDFNVFLPSEVNFVSSRDVDTDVPLINTTPVVYTVLFDEPIDYAHEMGVIFTRNRWAMALTYEIATALGGSAWETVAVMPSNAGNVSRAFIKGESPRSFGRTAYGVRFTLQGANDAFETVEIDRLYLYAGGHQGNMHLSKAGGVVTGIATPATAAAKTLANDSFTLDAKFVESYVTIRLPTGVTVATLRTINGGINGQRLIVRTSNNSIAVTLGSGGNLDFGSVAPVLASAKTVIELIYDAGLSKWLLL